MVNRSLGFFTALRRQTILSIAWRRKLVRSHGPSFGPVIGLVARLIEVDGLGPSLGRSRGRSRAVALVRTMPGSAAWYLSGTSSD